MTTLSVATPVKIVENEVEPPVVKPIVNIVESESTDITKVESMVDEVESTVDEVEDVEVVAPEINKITFRVTAYCSCPKCCGKWALNRPKDENGNDIVIGAGNVPLTSMVSVASPLPFGTKINLDGYGTLIVQDRTAQWVVDKYGKNILDIYVNNHDDIKNIGLQYLEGVIIE